MNRMTRVTPSPFTCHAKPIILQLCLLLAEGVCVSLQAAQHSLVRGSQTLWRVSETEENEIRRGKQKKGEPHEQKEIASTSKPST
jgi:hypothetical protein